jgi:positive regulator of sigma E activity
MKESGTVKDISGKLVIIDIPMHDGCQSCINGMCKDSRSALKAYNPGGIELSTGDQVEIELKSAEQVKVAFWVLGLPLVALFAGYGLGSLIFRSANEGPAVATAGALFILFLGIGLIIQKRRNIQALPVVTKRL